MCGGGFTCLHKHCTATATATATATMCAPASHDMKLFSLIFFWPNVNTTRSSTHNDDARLGLGRHDGFTL